MPAFANVEEVEARAGRDLTDAEQALAQALLEDATALIELEVGDFPDAVPPIVVAVTCAMVLRVVRNPEGVRQEGIEDAQRIRSEVAASGQLELLPGERQLLVKALARATGSTSSGGAFTIVPAYS